MTDVCEMHGLAPWLFHKEPFLRATWRRVMKSPAGKSFQAAMNAKPHLRTKAAALVKDGCHDPWQILNRLGLLDEQFTFRDGTTPAKKGSSLKSKPATAHQNRPAPSAGARSGA